MSIPDTPYPSCSVYSGTICFADNQFDLVVGCFNPCVAQSQSDCIQNVLLMAPDLFIKIMESRYPAVACFPESVLQIGLSLPDIRRFQKQPQGFFQAVCPVQLWIACPDHIQTNPLILCQVLRCFAQKIGRLFGRRSLLPRFLYLFSSLVS